MISLIIISVPTYSHSNFHFIRDYKGSFVLRYKVPCSVYIRHPFPGIVESPWKPEPLFFEEKTENVTSDSLVYFFSFYRMIVTPLTEGQDPGKSSDEKYVDFTRNYENQEDGKPYITAEFANNEPRTSFPVGDGKYYSINGVTEAKRKRRATSELTVRCMLYKAWFSLRHKHKHKQNKSFCSACAYAYVK